MISIISKIFMKNPTSYQDVNVRSMYGVICGGVGICFNIFLFFMKFFAGLISGSIAITADAFNNLSDAGSSIITLLGFRLARQKPDHDHPYGHGRMEYLSGFVVAMLILLMGYELITSSIDKILHPEEILYTPVIFFILLISILVKLYMYFYNHGIGKKINSTALEATAKDSLSDMVSTAVVLICSVIGMCTSLNLEGYCGVLVGGFVCFAGFGAAKDTLSPLLGQAPDPELVKEIQDIVMNGDGVLGIHDLMVHDYGPGRLVISLHAEVPADGDILELHDSIDNIEKQLQNKLSCNAVIHMDPICNKDEETMELRSKMYTYIQSLSKDLNLHDFRIVKGTTHTNIIFDVVSPFDFYLTDEELIQTIKEHIASMEGNYFGVITVDKP